MSKNWSREETAILEDLFQGGLSYVEIARALPDRTAGAVQIRASWLGLKRREHNFALPRGVDLRRDNLLHLLDLKRAGHSPTRTELAIGADTSTPLRFCAPLPASPCGSSGAACVELG